ncbi:hypothetical protein B0J18DRAFT_97602 [Chaetomium sp. MPI-SDFR-AT-0129]|nr:hypothetical protein B0J18DRAFT_97602 [Chaetomium sp. MPI-SDFR-AT-0129]
MAPPQPFSHHRPRVRSRSFIFILLGGLTFLTFCLFVSHLPALQYFTSLPLSGSTAGNWMTSSSNAAPSPEDDNQAALAAAQQLLDLIEQDMAEKVKNLKMEYGTNSHPPFKDDPPMLVADLPQEHIPSYTPASPKKGSGGHHGGGGKGGKHPPGKRLVIVGDVHGHRAALQALLRKIGFDHKHGDHLVLAGDITTKGPDSKGVVKLAMQLGASAVRGNQDDRVLAAARELHRYAEEENRGSGVGKKGRREDDAHAVARSLSRSQLAWLRSLPIILRVGELPDAASAPWNATLVVVHGGLVPGIKLERQDPWAVMNMRSLVYPRKGGRKKKAKHHGRGEPGESLQEEEEVVLGQTVDQFEDFTLSPDAIAVPIDTRDGEPWSHAWNQYQNHLPPHVPRTVVIYGHDARAGLQVKPKVSLSTHYPSSPFGATSSQEKNDDPTSDVTSNDSDTDADATDDDAINHPSPTNTNKPSKKTKKPNKKNQQKKKRKTSGLRYAFGLDSGCGHGKQLTALVLEATLDESSTTSMGEEDYDSYIPNKHKPVAGQGIIKYTIEQVDCMTAAAEAEAEAEAGAEEEDEDMAAPSAEHAENEPGEDEEE